MEKSVWLAALVMAALSAGCAPSLLARDDTVGFVNHSDANLPDRQRLFGAVTDEGGAVIAQGQFFDARHGSSRVDAEALEAGQGTYRGVAVIVACEPDCEDQIRDGALAYSGAHPSDAPRGVQALAACDELFSLHGNGRQNVVLVLREVDVERRSCRLDIEIGEE